VLGWTSAVGPAFIIPKVLATRSAGHPEYALYGFVAFYVSCLAVNWWFYARKGAPLPC
jgi:NNP family nitrate/nitrite transporter-like MFS transporter